MVASSHHLATDVGAEVLSEGGNAIDAAVAVGFALAVVDPCCGNLGGGGFMLIHFADGTNTFLDFRETAPLKINSKLFFDAQNHPQVNLLRKGYLAVGVPGSVLGFTEALRKYGSFSLPRVLQPAINLARNGFILAKGDIEFLAPMEMEFKEQANVAAIFLKQNNSYREGDRFIQNDLANTLEQISTQGPEVFYKGTITDKIVKASHLNGGVLTKEDFESYVVKERQPLACSYHGFQVLTAPPPSGGGVVLCEMLNVLEPYPLTSWGYRSLLAIHYTLEAMRYAFLDRNKYLGDPDFVKNPLRLLLSKQHAEFIRSQISPYRASHPSAVIPVEENSETTHYSIMDKYGNAVSVTYTLNGNFGANVIAGDTGFFLNSEMDDFTLAAGVSNQYKLIQGRANLIQPKKRPLSSMAPTIILIGNKVFMILGAPGGSTIPTQLLETLMNVMDFGLNLQKAVDAPRFHLQAFPNTVYMEPNAFPFFTLLRLGWMGYHFQLGSPYGSLRWGAVAAILRDPETGKLFGAVDNRRPESSYKVINNGSKSPEQRHFLLKVTT